MHSLMVVSLALSFAAQRSSPDSLADSLIQQRVKAGTNPAIVVGILENGQTRIRSAGVSGAPNGTLDGNTVFEIGSITKVFTSTVLADMARQGEVSLDDPVAKFFPGGTKIPARGGRSITLVDLSTQHSGLPRLPDNLPAANPNNPYADYTPELLLAFLAKYELTRDIGSQFEYSNLGVGLLGEALSRRAGLTYEEMIARRVTGPLEMNDTRIALTSDMTSRLARGHDAQGHPAQNWDVRGIPGAGALRSTANDMLKFARAAMSSSGPLAGAFADAQQPRRPIGPGQQIGLNWFTVAAGPIVITWHNGGTGGYRSFLGLDRAHQRAVVVLTNSANGVDDIGQRILIDAAQPPKS